MKRAYVPAGASRDGPMGFIKLGFGAKKVQPTYIQKCIFEAYDVACNGVWFLILTLLLNR
jgi:hypothetical protein